MEFTLNKSQRLVTNAAAKEEDRPVLTCVHIRKGIIEAGNGYIAVQKPIEYDGDEEILLKSKELAKCKGASVAFSKVEGSSEVRAKGQETIILEAQSGEFPNIDKLYQIATPTAVLNRLAGRKEAFKIALSRSKLISLLNSFDDDIVRFYFYGRESPVKLETEDAKGIMMPMSVNWEE